MQENLGQGSSNGTSDLTPCLSLNQREGPGLDTSGFLVPVARHLTPATSAAQVVSGQHMCPTPVTSGKQGFEHQTGLGTATGSSHCAVAMNNHIYDQAHQFYLTTRSGLPDDGFEKAAPPFALYDQRGYAHRQLSYWDQLRLAGWTVGMLENQISLASPALPDYAPIDYAGVYNYPDGHWQTSLMPSRQRPDGRQWR